MMTLTQKVKEDSLDQPVDVQGYAGLNHVCG
jgi:hypothetical protein